jgi:hypothetical protein
MEMVTPEVEEAVWLASCVEDGHWPVGGGVLDQSYSFLESLGEINRIKSELNG